MIWVGLGGMIGAVLRYTADSIFAMLFNPGYPALSILFVNLTGCLIMGYISGKIHSGSSEEMTLRLFLMTGILGSFTTFSGFTIQALSLIEQSVPLFILFFFGQPVIGLVLMIAGSYLSVSRKK
ncbi:MAG: CrcB family protein [Balneolaceae bacterium]|nr:CrcB family protein [Balneolaceae bacterium]